MRGIICRIHLGMSVEGIPISWRIWPPLKRCFVPGRRETERGLVGDVCGREYE